MIDSNDFELVVINTPLPDEFGHELSIMIAEASTAGIILICKSDISDEVSDKVGDFGVCVVPKPINRTPLFLSFQLSVVARRTVVTWSPFGM